jgi:hypothetical protein
METGDGLAVTLPDDVQDDIIIFRVLMMAVSLPLAGFDVNLDIPARDTAVDNKNSVFEIAAAPVADSARKDYMKRLTGIGHRVSHLAALPQA